MALALLFAALFGLLAYWLLVVIPQHRPPTRLLALVPTNYPEHGPINPLATEDLALFRNVFNDYDNVRLEVPEGDIETSQGFLRNLGDFLQTATPAAGDPAPLVVYLNAIGLVSSAGEPCLLLPRHDPLDDATWLTWDKLHERILRDRPESTPVVLLLDAQQIETDWSIGVVQNGFVPLLQQSLADQDDENLVVISSTTGLQGRLAPITGRVTPFAYHAANGFRGAADADNDARLTLTEYVDYLATTVSDWTSRHAWQVQRPALLTPSRQASLQLAEVADWESLGAIESSPPQENASEIKRLWEAYARTQESGVSRYAPVLSARVASDLVRIDQFVLAGAGYDAQRDSLVTETKRRLNRLEQAQPYPTDLHASTLAERAQWGPPGSSPAKLAEVWDAWREKPEEAPAPRLYADRVAGAWGYLVQPSGHPAEADFSNAVKFLDAADTARQTPDFAEAALIRLLHTKIDWAHITPPPLTELLHQFSESFRHAIPPRPEVRPWVLPLAKSFEADLNGALDLALSFEADLNGALDLAQSAEVSIRRKLRNTERKLQELERVSNAATEAYDTRDKALALLLPAAEWAQKLSRVDPLARPLLTRDLPELDTAVTQLAKTLRLGPSAFSDEYDSTIIGNRLNSEALAVRQVIKRVRGEYLRRVDLLARREQGSLIDTRPERSILLQSPFAMNKEWVLLRDVFLSGERSGGSQTPSSVPDEEHLEWLATPYHPLARLGEATPPPPQATSVERLRYLAKLGGGIRKAVRQCGGDIDSALSKTEKGLADGDLESAKQPLAESADRLRRQILLARNGPLVRSGDNHAIAHLRAFNGHAWSLWQAERAVSALWRSEPNDKPAWFEQAARRRLDEAQRTFECRPNRAVVSRRRSVDRVVATLRSWTPAPALSLFVGGGTARVNRSIELSRIEIPESPAAIATTRVLRSGGDAPADTPPLVRHQHAVGAPSPLRLLGRSEDLIKAATLSVQTLLRGHTWESPLEITGGVPTEFERPKPQAAKIRVVADQGVRNNVVFVFDCSATMNRSLGGANMKRIEAARESLKGALAQLQAQGGDHHAALIFYGRRAGVTSEKLVKHRPDSSYRGHPGDDVEIAVGLQNLDNFLDEAGRRLDEATPWGLTPLYRAVEEALKTLRHVNGKRRIVVLTDGLDDPGAKATYDLADRVLGPKTVTRRPPVTTTDLITKLQSRPPPQIDILLFGAEANDELTRLAEEPSVRLVRKEDLKRDWLSEQLREMLGVEDFLVAPLEQTKAERQASGLGGQIILPPGGGAYAVSLERGGAAPFEVTVEGGESLELVYQREEQRLVSEAHPAHATVRAGRYLVGAHLDERVGDDVPFRFSIQSSDPARYCPRPEVVWVKLTPHTRRTNPRNDTQTPRYYLDRHFAPGKRVPVMELPGNQDWPTQYATAEICFAMRRPKRSPIAVPQSGSEPVTRRVGDATLSILHRRLPEGERQILVNETHPLGDPDYPLHIQITPPADRVARSFSEENSATEHVFFYRELREPPRLHVLTKAQIIEAGEGPVELTVEVSN